MKSVCPETLDKLREESFQIESKRSPHLLQMAEKGARENPVLPWCWKKMRNTKQLSFFSTKRVKNSIGPADNFPRMQHIHLKQQQMTLSSSEKREQSSRAGTGQGVPLAQQSPWDTQETGRGWKFLLVVVMESLLPQQRPFPWGRGWWQACLPAKGGGPLASGGRAAGGCEKATQPQEG